MIYVLIGYILKSLWTFCTQILMYILSWLYYPSYVAFVLLQRISEILLLPLLIIFLILTIPLRIVFFGIKLFCLFVLALMLLPRVLYEVIWNGSESGRLGYTRNIYQQRMQRRLSQI